MKKLKLIGLYTSILYILSITALFATAIDKDFILRNRTHFINPSTISIDGIQYNINFAIPYVYKVREESMMSVTEVLESYPEGFFSRYTWKDKAEDYEGLYEYHLPSSTFIISGHEVDYSYLISLSLTKTNIAPPWERGGGLLSVKDNDTRLLSIAERLERIHLQVPKVLRHIKERGDNAKIDLILGVRDVEDDLDRFNENCVFLNLNHTNPLGNNRLLSVDFNDVNELQALEPLYYCFDRIIPDFGVYKMTEWETDHLLLLKNLLKPGGQFIYDPEFGFGTVFKRDSLTTLKALDCTFFDDAVRKHLLCFSDTKCHPLVVNVNVSSDVYKSFLAKPGMSKKRLVDYLFVHTVVPFYGARFEHVFGKGSIGFELDSLLPFRARGHSTVATSYIMTVTKKPE